MESWICGNKAHGCPCHQGPDNKGRCGATAQCSPIKLEERWHCTRSTIHGGQCAQGPSPDGQCCNQQSPCSPIPGPKQHKRYYLQLTSLFLLSFLLLGLSSPWFESFSSPGPLARAHAGIAQCQSCHAQQATLTPVNIIENLLNPVSVSEHNKQCTACHEMGENSLNPHQLKQNGVAETQVNIPAVHQQGLACATCHKEHQGQLMPNKSMQTSYCLSCHEKPLYRFADNHPEFLDYPIKVIKRIRFDHKAHIERHFTKEPALAPDSCANCHGLDTTGTPTVASFEQSCQSCHQKDVMTENLATGPKGFAVLSIPGLDIDTLQSNNIDIGQWPKWSEEPLNPIWFHLLPNIAKSLDSQELLDLSNAEPEKLQQIQSMALDIKKYLHQLKTYGSSQASQSWTLQLSRHEVKNAIEQWFPALDSEMPLIAAGTPPATQAYSPQTKRLQTTDVSNTEDGSFDFDDDNILDDEQSEDSLGELFSDDNSAEDDTDLNALFGNDETSITTETTTATNLTTDTEQWMKQGGWYLKEFALYYRATGHRDSNFQAWLSQAPQWFDEDSSGRCLKCHNINSDQPNSWQAEQRHTIAAKLTSFDHQQHMNMLNTNDCQNCHAITADTEQQDFEPIKKQQCQNCHNEQTQLNQCSTCHNYHLPWNTSDFSSKSAIEFE